MLATRAARTASNEAEQDEKPAVARVASRAAAASKKQAEAAATRAEAHAASSPGAKALAVRAHEHAMQADIDARAARRTADSLSRRATGRFRR